MFKLLRLIENKNLKEIEKGKLKANIFEQESEMREFFTKNDNINKIFPSLYYLFSERKVNPKSIADTIVFNPNDKSFIIFEHKLNSEIKLKQIINYKNQIKWTSQKQ